MTQNKEKINSKDAGKLKIDPEFRNIQNIAN